MNDLWPPPQRYGLDRSAFAAQITRFTASGAFVGAAACPPKCRRAVLPAIVGPEDGNCEAVVDEINAAKTAAPSKVLGMKECTELFESGWYAKKRAAEKEKN